MEIIAYGKQTERLKKILARSFSYDKKILAKVKAIISNVRERGDKALFAYTKQFDKISHTAETIVVNKDYLDRCLKQADAGLVSILKEAGANIRKYHLRQKQSSWVRRFADGVKLGQKIIPLEKVGVYVPGGEAFYPSTVLMNIIPAQIAGVEQIIVATPPGHFLAKPLVGATLSLLGIDKAYLVGGAQAIAALAYGTESVPRVDKIVGPGNTYVSLAKREVFGIVDIDMIAGPTEIVVLAQQGVSPEWVALDLLSQAEHRTGFESAILVTDSPELAGKVQSALEKNLADSEHKSVIGRILNTNGAIIMVDSMEQGTEVVNKIAPEHLELLVQNPEKILARIKNAGAVFIGNYSCESVGDYWAGPNHVLPTGGSARFFSPLGVYDFIKRSSLIYYTRKALGKNARKINALATAENLLFHGKAVMKRLEDMDKGKKSE